MAWDDKLQLWQIRLSVMVVVIQAGLLAVYWRSLPPEIPLFYSRPWGNEQLGSLQWLIMPPVLSGVVGIGAAMVANTLKKDEKLLGGIIMITAMVIQVIATFGLFRILKLVL